MCRVHVTQAASISKYAYTIYTLAARGSVTSAAPMITILLNQSHFRGVNNFALKNKLLCTKPFALKKKIAIGIWALRSATFILGHEILGILFLVCSCN